MCKGMDPTTGAHMPQITITMVYVLCGRGSAGCQYKPSTTHDILYNIMLANLDQNTFNYPTEILRISLSRNIPDILSKLSFYVIYDIGGAILNIIAGCKNVFRLNVIECGAY